MSYVNPLPKGAVRKTGDQGVDYQGKPGDPVVAIGAAHIDKISPDPGGFGIAIYYTLLDGKGKGKQIYVGHAKPTVQENATVVAGQQIAVLQQVPGGNAAPYPGWTEIGIAKNNTPKYHGHEKIGHHPHTPGSNEFEALLAGASDAPVPTSSAAPATSSDSVDSQGAVTGTFDPQLGSDVASIPQAEGAPTAHAPVSGEFGGPQAPPPNPQADTWQLIAAQGPISPDTVRLAQLAGYNSVQPPA